MKSKKSILILLIAVLVGVVGFQQKEKLKQYISASIPHHKLELTKNYITGIRCKYLSGPGCEFTFGMMPMSRSTWAELMQQSYAAPFDEWSSDEMVSHLTLGRFNELENYFEDVNLKFHHGSISEWQYFDAHTNLSLAGQNNLDLLAKWVSHSPNNIYPYLARADSYLDIGWNKRGVRLARHLTDDEWKNMESYHLLAAADFYKAVSIDPRYLHLFKIAVRLFKNSQLGIDARKWMDKAIEIYPETYLVRFQYMRNLKPRWGGSYPELREFAMEAQKYVDLNPRLRALLGYEFFDQDSWHSESSKASVGHLSKAIYHGPLFRWHSDRASKLVNTGRYEFAIEDLKFALNHQSNHLDATINLLRIHMSRKEYALAKEISENQLAELDNSSEAWFYRGYLQLQMGEYPV